MRTFVSLAAAAALAVGVSIGAQSAQATTLSFFPISGNSGEPEVIAVGNQLSVLVENVGGDASFTFVNDVGWDSSVTAVYFDDGGSLLGSATITSSVATGVNFSEGATPPDLPGGSAHSFSATYSADSDTPPPANGLNEAADWLTIVFELLGGVTFTDIATALMNGDLRIGMQVQSIDGLPSNLDSAQYLNNPTPIPLPAGLVLFLSGLAGVGFLGRYKARRRETAVA